MTEYCAKNTNIQSYAAAGTRVTVHKPSTRDKMSFVVSGFVDQIEHSLDCNACNGIALFMPVRAKILTSGIAK